MEILPPTLGILAQYGIENILLVFKVVVKRAFLIPTALAISLTDTASKPREEKSVKASRKILSLVFIRTSITIHTNNS
jgi:hypothetical protein